MTKDNRYSDDYYAVNQILAEWNPIEVPETIAESEYTMYVPNILKYRNDYAKLIIELKKIVHDKIGLTIENKVESNTPEISQIARRIIETLKDNELITFSQLSFEINNDNYDSKIKAKAELFIKSITDYPIYNLKEPNNFLNELKNEIGFPLTYDLINKYESKLNFDNQTDIWKKQALTSILEMYDLDRNKTLDELVREISIYYKKKPTKDKNKS